MDEHRDDTSENRAVMPQPDDLPEMFREAEGATTDDLWWRALGFRGGDEEDEDEHLPASRVERGLIAAVQAARQKCLEDFADDPLDEAD